MNENINMLLFYDSLFEFFFFLLFLPITIQYEMYKICQWDRGMELFALIFFELVID